MDSLFISGLGVDWNAIAADSYLRAIPALAGVSHVGFDAPVTFFVGDNGSGKSTLLEAIAVAAGFNPEGGTRNYRFSTYDSHSGLCDALTLERGFRRPAGGYFLRAESFYNVATKELEYADAKHPSLQLHERSHGEGFLAMVQSYFHPGGLYLLDEPEAALSPSRQLTLLLEIDRCVRGVASDRSDTDGRAVRTDAPAGGVAGGPASGTASCPAQFIIATHSPILLGLPGARILGFDGGPIRAIAYEETESYQLTSMFINDRERLLHHLLEE